MARRARELSGLEQALGHRFRDPALLRHALTHASATGGGAAGIRDSNERLEFLGDRVLGLLVAELLYARFPDEPEGALGRRFAAAVRRETLADVARAVGIGEHLVLAPGEDLDGGRAKPGMLEDACEAVVAALYLDGGLDAARAFVEAHWIPHLDLNRPVPKDAKNELQEWALARGLPLPVYREASRSGPDHAPEFRIEVMLPGFAPAAGTGPSKRQAERMAAEMLLAAIQQSQQEQ